MFSALVRREWLGTVGLVLGVLLITKLGFLGPLERATLDVLYALPRSSSDLIRVVSIGDEDFVKLFRGQRPLDPEMIRCAIFAVAALKPRVIGIDLITPLATWSESEWMKPIGSNYPDDCQQLSLSAAEHRDWLRERLVWAVDPQPVRSTDSTVSWVTALREVARQSDPPLMLTASKVPTYGSIGSVGLWSDYDGIARRYSSVARVILGRTETAAALCTDMGGRRASAVDGGSPENVCVLPTLSGKLANQYCASRGPDGAIPDPISRCDDIRERLRNATGADAKLVDFVGPRSHVPVYPLQGILDIASTRDAAAPGGRLFDKIVLIGSTFAEARDKYYTPVGAIDGVTLVAHMVNSDLRRGGIQENHAYDLALDLVCAFLLIYVNARWIGRRRVLGAAVIGTITTVLFVSAAIFLFWLPGFWLGLPALVLGVWLHQGHVMKHVGVHHATQHP